MSGLLLALLAVLLAGVGARDQMVLAELVRRQGPRTGLLCVALLTSCATAAFAAWAAGLVAPLLTADARTIFAAIALGFGGAESLLLSPGRKPEEPTHSLGAALLVLLVHQLSDAARFLVFAIAVATQAPVPAGVGGAIGGSLLLGAAWSMPEWFDWQRLRVPRRIIGALLLMLAVWLGLSSVKFH
jgi:hypothetical protein